MAGAAVLSAFTYTPILARDTMGIPEVQITLLVGAYATAAFLASYIFGRAGDIYGRRIVIRLGLLVAMLSFALLIISADFQTLFIVRTINGFCVGMYPGALAAYAYESKMKMGRFATWGAAGWGLGTLLAGYAAGTDIYLAFVVSTLFLVVAFASALTLPPIEHEMIRVPLFPIDTFKRNMSIYLSVFIRHSSAFAIWTLWPLFLADRFGANTLMIGIIQATNAISQVFFMAAITDRIDCRKLGLIGFGSSAITFVWFILAADFFQLILTQILLGLAWATMYVGALKYVTEKNEERSTASGLLQSILSISGVFGPIYAAILFTIWPFYEPIMLFAALMSVLALVLFYLNKDGDSVERVPLVAVEGLAN
jgi:MFS family permease